MHSANAKALRVEDLRAAALALLELAAEHEECSGSFKPANFGIYAMEPVAGHDGLYKTVSGLETRDPEHVESRKLEKNLLLVVRSILDIANRREARRARDRALTFRNEILAAIERELAPHGGWGGDLHRPERWRLIKTSLVEELSQLATRMNGFSVSPEQTAEMLARVSDTHVIKDGTAGLAKVVAVSLVNPQPESQTLLRNATKTLPAKNVPEPTSVRLNKRVMSLQYLINCMGFGEEKNMIMDSIVDSFYMADIMNLEERDKPQSALNVNADVLGR